MRVVAMVVVVLMEVGRMFRLRFRFYHDSRLVLVFAIVVVVAVIVHVDAPAQGGLLERPPRLEGGLQCGPLLRLGLILRCPQAQAQAQWAVLVVVFLDCDLSRFPLRSKRAHCVCCRA